MRNKGCAIFSSHTLSRGASSFSLMTLNIMSKLRHSAKHFCSKIASFLKYKFAECGIIMCDVMLSVVMLSLSIVMLNVTMLCFVMLSVIVVSVEAPFHIPPTCPFSKPLFLFFVPNPSSPFSYSMTRKDFDIV
jgi:hypothetical protein